MSEIFFCAPLVKPPTDITVKNIIERLVELADGSSIRGLGKSPGRGGIPDTNPYLT